MVGECASNPSVLHSRDGVNAAQARSIHSLKIRWNTARSLAATSICGSHWRILCAPPKKGVFRASSLTLKGRTEYRASETYRFGSCSRASFRLLPFGANASRAISAPVPEALMTSNSTPFSMKPSIAPDISVIAGAQPLSTSPIRFVSVMSRSTSGSARPAPPPPTCRVDGRSQASSFRPQAASIWA